MKMEQSSVQDGLYEDVVTEIIDTYNCEENI